MIAFALKNNKYTALKDLNMKLNCVTDKGGVRFFQVISSVKSLQYLNLAANALGKSVLSPFSLVFKTAMQLADYLADTTCSLKSLDLSSNSMEKTAYRYL